MVGKIGLGLTFIGVVISIIQLYKQSKQLKTIDNNLESIITDFAEEQYLYTKYDNTGFELIIKEQKLKETFVNEFNEKDYISKLNQDKKICEGDHNDIRFIINIINNSNKRIQMFSIDDLKIKIETEVNLLEFEPIERQKYIQIEKTEGNKYNFTIILKAPKKIIKKIEEVKTMVLTFDLNLLNDNNIVTPSWNEIAIDKGEEYMGDKIKYLLHTEKYTGRTYRIKNRKVFKLKNK